MELATSHPELLIEDVGKTFDASFGARTQALRDIRLSVGAHELVALVGTSGCGKSTLLRIVAGLEREFLGRVLVDGRAVGGPGPDRGMVFQEHRLLPWLTVADNIAFGIPEILGAKRNDIVREQLESVGLAGFSGAYPHQLSGGMAQRAALARALAASPRVLLLDEPFAALDAFTKVQLQESLLALRSAWQPTIVLVTHDIEEAVFLADRVVVMSARPGTIRRVIPIELAHPRDRTSAAFSELRALVLRELNEGKSPAPTAGPATLAQTGTA